MCVYTHIYIHIVSMESIEPPVRSTNPIRLLKHLHTPRGDGIATPAVEVDLFAKEAGDSPSIAWR